MMNLSPNTRPQDAGMPFERLMLLLALHRMTGLRWNEKLLLLDICRDPQDLVRLDLQTLHNLLGPQRPRGTWSPAAALALASADIDSLASLGAVYLHYDDARYPPLLRETATPPFGLFCRGEVPAAGVASIAVVGTRQPSGAGLRAAWCFARDLGQAGLPMISGLALGVDGVAHRSCMVAGGATWAVLPCGVDRIYPLTNRGLASSMLATGGGLISEYPPGEEIHRYRFPERNRIIAGMTRGCVIIQAPRHSGALITAEHALSEGRDVYVHADCLGRPGNEGCDALAAEGAPSLTCAQDLLDEWAQTAVVGTEGCSI